MLVGQPLILQFSVTEASPAVKVNDIQWLLSSSGSEAPVSDSMLSLDRLSLFVADVSTVNEGRYLVSVSNPAGRDEVAITVTVEGIILNKFTYLLTCLLTHPLNFPHVPETCLRQQCLLHSTLLYLGRVSGT